ncbi:hypothetical protein FQA47_002731 [Oryzias melastigma]|uniref:Uncharacterized protein n=1 Tax=Oryzias melastigma TaxID=30732 RepID=A0A834BZC1_ORYME|nr:hypothetical protein FQA47_002731 [Oryzias melastigma]
MGRMLLKTGASFSTGQLPSLLRSALLRQTGGEKQPHTPVSIASDIHGEGHNFTYNLLGSSSSRAD